MYLVAIAVGYRVSMRANKVAYDEHWESTGRWRDYIPCELDSLYIRNDAIARM